MGVNNINQINKDKLIDINEDNFADELNSKVFLVAKLSSLISIN